MHSFINWESYERKKDNKKPKSSKPIKKEVVMIDVDNSKNITPPTRSVNKKGFI